MKRCLSLAGFVAIALLAMAGIVPLDAMAQPAGPSPTTVNFSPFVADVVVPALGAIITGAIVYGVQRWIGVKLDDQAKATVNDVLQKALAYGQSKVGQLPLQVDVRSPLIATAANYALQHGPDALKRLGVSPDQLAEKLVARWHDPSVPVGVGTPPATATG